LADAMLNGDARLGGARQWWSDRIALPLLQDITGLPMRDTWSANVVRHHLEALGRDRPALFLTFEDLVVSSIGVRARTSLSLAARSMMVDRRSRRWSPAIMDILGLDEAAMPSLALPGEILGTTGSDNDWGLPAGTIVASGGHDQFCAAVGSGATTTIPMWSTGTVDSFVTLTNDAPLGMSALPQYEVDDGLYTCTIPNLNGGRALSWLSGLFRVERIEEAFVGRDPPERILVLPTFGTTGAPDFDPGRTGGVLGLSYTDTGETIAAAVVEGIVLETRQAIMGSGFDPASFEAIAVAGGSAQSRRWLGLKANALNLPVMRRSNVDAGTVGAAMLARQAIDGRRANIDQANPLVDTILPSGDGVDRMMRQAARYEALRELVI
jgi:xylulokinase